MKNFIKKKEKKIENLREAKKSEEVVPEQKKGRKTDFLKRIEVYQKKKENKIQALVEQNEKKKEEKYSTLNFTPTVNHRENDRKLEDMLCWEEKRKIKIE